MAANRSTWLLSILLPAACLAQAPATEEELAKQTALLKAQQQYYDQLAATARSQQAVADASAAAQVATLTLAGQVQAAQYGNEFALANALKAGGISPATGKEGTTAIAGNEKPLLAMQGESLEVVGTLVADLCADLKARQGAQPVFLAPANYELLAQKSVGDVVQLVAMRTTAARGLKEFEGVQLQSAFAGIAGGLAAVQYLAGGIQAVAKLFRTDYSIGVSAGARQGHFEQALAAGCKGQVESNVEGRLRMNGAAILAAWLPDIAKFIELHESQQEAAALRKATLTARRAAAAADETVKADEKAKRLKLIDGDLEKLRITEETLAKYKLAVAGMKAFLAGLASNTAVLDAMVWGQPLLVQSGGIPAQLPAGELPIDRWSRLSYTLTVQEASVKASSTFSSEKLKPLATGELVYAVNDSKGRTVLAGALSRTQVGAEIETKKLNFAQPTKTY